MHVTLALSSFTDTVPGKNKSTSRYYVGFGRVWDPLTKSGGIPPVGCLVDELICIYCRLLLRRIDGERYIFYCDSLNRQLRVAWTIRMCFEWLRLKTTSSNIPCTASKWTTMQPLPGFHGCDAVTSRLECVLVNNVAPSHLKK